MTKPMNAAASELFPRIVCLSYVAKALARLDTDDQHGLVQAMCAHIDEIARIAQSGMDAPASTDDGQGVEPGGITAGSALTSMQPLLGMSESALSDLLRHAGMYPPSKSWRCGPAAFQPRRDVSVSDALDTLRDRLAQVSGVLRLLSTDANGDEITVSAASAASDLLDEAMGMHALVTEVMYRPQKSEGGAA